MFQMLIDFFDTYPDNLLGLKGKLRSEVPSDLMERIQDHKERQQFILGEAHLFRLDDDVEWMLDSLIDEMKRDGLEDIFLKVKLPFPVILLERAALTDGFKLFGLLTQEGDTIYTQRFLVQQEGLVPSTMVLRSSGLVGNNLPTPTQELTRFLSGKDELADALEVEEQTVRYLLGLAVAMSTLLGHRGMLEVEEASSYSRPERRRAEKAGRPLPATRVSKITLGEAGRGQVAAMRDVSASGEGEKGRRRAHWVRGHYMRNQSGGASWRMPHIRGAGPLVSQERHVVADPPK